MCVTRSEWSREVAISPPDVPRYGSRDLMENCLPVDELHDVIKWAERATAALEPMIGQGKFIRFLEWVVLRVWRLSHLILSSPTREH